MRARFWRNPTVGSKKHLFKFIIGYRISLVQIISIIVYIANTSLTHTHACTNTSPFRLSLFDRSLAPHCDAVNAPFRRVAGDQSWPVVGLFK